MELVNRLKRALSKRFRTLEAAQLAKKRMFDMYAKVFSTPEGQEVLDYMIKMELTGSIAEQGDNLLDIGVKQGRADLVKDIINKIDTSKRQGDGNGES